MKKNYFVCSSHIVPRLDALNFSVPGYRLLWVKAFTSCSGGSLPAITNSVCAAGQATGNYTAFHISTTQEVVQSSLCDQPIFGKAYMHSATFVTLSTRLILNRFIDGEGFFKCSNSIVDSNGFVHGARLSGDFYYSISTSAHIFCSSAIFESQINLQHVRSFLVGVKHWFTIASTFTGLNCFAVGLSSQLYRFNVIKYRTAIISTVPNFWDSRLFNRYPRPKTAFGVNALSGFLSKKLIPVTAGSYNCPSTLFHSDNVTAISSAVIYRRSVHDCMTETSGNAGIIKRLLHFN